jgi:glucose-6-phosphate isomerase
MMRPHSLQMPRAPFGAGPFEHDVTGWQGQRLGAFGLSADECQPLFARGERGLDWLRRAYDDGSLPVLHLPEREDDLEAMRPIAQDWRARFSHVVVLGIGGSSLGGATLTRLVQSPLGNPRSGPRVLFQDTIDPESWDRLMETIELERTGFIVISKSGGTDEPLAQLLALMPLLDERALAERLIAITEPGDNLLRRLAARHSFRVLDHDPNIGGRFSGLSVVGVLPAMIAGLDPGLLRHGALQVLRESLDARRPEESAPALGAAFAVGYAEARGIRQSVLMPYVDKLGSLAAWWAQLWAESLGKGGHGMTPIRAQGPVDQHSQLQLYLDGPRDKLFTLILGPASGLGAELAGDGPPHLARRRMGDLLDAEQRATADTLIGAERPTRVIRLNRVDEEALGALMMHFMLETMLAAHHWTINAFDQPAVEEGKRRARKILGAPNP